MLIVEELYLLLTNAEGTQEKPGTQRAYGEVAALVTDLMLAERVTVTEEKRPSVHVISTEPTGHPVLDFGLPLVATKHGKRLERVIVWGKLDPEEHVVASLVAAGVLTLGARTMLGMGRPRTPEADPEPERRIRARLAAVLGGTAPASVPDATLLSVLQGLGVAHRILAVESGGMRARELKERIAAVVAGSAAGTAVERAVQAMNAAVMTAAIMPAMVAGGMSGG